MRYLNIYLFALDRIETLNLIALGIDQRAMRFYCNHLIVILRQGK